MRNFKTPEQTIRAIREAQANAGVLQYGTDIARDTYADDTPGQEPGDHTGKFQPVLANKTATAVDGVPKKGGEMVKPNPERLAGLGKKESFKGNPYLKIANSEIIKEDAFEQFVEMSDVEFEDMIEVLTDEELDDLHEGIMKSIGKGIGAVAKGAVKAGKWAAPKIASGVKKAAHRMTVAGRADAAEKRLKAIKQKKLDRERLKKAQAGIQKQSDDMPKRPRILDKLRTSVKRYQQTGSTKKPGSKQNPIIWTPKGKKPVADSFELGSRDYWTETDEQDLAEGKMSPSEVKKAASAIWKMRQDRAKKLQTAADKEASSAIKAKRSKAAVAARKDAAAEYGKPKKDPADIDISHKEPKRGRGQKDLPHIVSQLRGVVDTKDGSPTKVKFKDGTTKDVKPKHAQSWLKKHDSAKPAQKLDMYKSHDSHKTFKSYAKEENDIDEAKVKNCGCGQNPCVTYGSKEQQMQEGQRKWDRSSRGRAYRRLSDEEKKRLAKKNELIRQMRAYRGDDESYESRGKMRKPTLGGAKSVYKGRKTRREQMEGIILGIEMKFLQEEEKMAGVEYYPRMKAHGKMTDAQKKAVTAVYDKKKVDKKMSDDPHVKKAQRYMKIEQAIKEWSDGRGGDVSDASKPSDLDKDRKMRNKLMKHDINKGRDIGKINYSSPEQRKRAQKKFAESSSWLDRTADTWNDHADHKHPKVQKHIKKAEKAYNDKDYDAFHHHTNRAADHAHTLRQTKKEEVVNELSTDTLQKYQTKVLSKTPPHELDSRQIKNLRRAGQKIYDKEYSKTGKPVKDKSGKTVGMVHKEEVVNELDSKTLKNYIRKAASPVNKPSAVNLASKGAWKLAKSADHDLDAGEKEDAKAYNRARGIQRAAKKLYKRTTESIDDVKPSQWDRANKSFKPKGAMGGPKKPKLDPRYQKGGKHHPARDASMMEGSFNYKSMAKDYLSKNKGKKHSVDSVQAHLKATEHEYDTHQSVADKHGHNAGETMYHVKKMTQKKPVNEISDTAKVSYIKKANKEITKSEKQLDKAHSQGLDKNALPGLHKRKEAEIKKRRLGVRLAKSKLGEGRMKELLTQKQEKERLAKQKKPETYKSKIAAKMKNEATYDQVLKHRYQSDHPADNPQRSAYLGKHKSSGMDTYKPIPGSSADSKKGKMAAIKKQLKRRPKQYGITGKHDPLYKQKQGSVQTKPARQKSKRTAGQYMDQKKGENLAGRVKKESVKEHASIIAMKIAERQYPASAEADMNKMADKRDKTWWKAQDKAKQREDSNKAKINKINNMGTRHGTY